MIFCTEPAFPVQLLGRRSPLRAWPECMQMERPSPCVVWVSGPLSKKIQKIENFIAIRYFCPYNEMEDQK